MALNKDKINKIFPVILFLGYLFFNGILFALHEPWRDEANVWLLARELSPIELFREIKYQGHPCLWYLLAMPFAKLGFPFRTIEVLSFFVMSGTALLLLWKAPMNSTVKGICLFSPVFTYFYPVIARNYCLIALLLMILAWQYPKRNENSVLYGLLLGLLVQADTIAIAEAGMISLMWLCENIWQGLRTKNLTGSKNVLKGIWIPAASLGLWILQFYQVSDSPQFKTRDLGLSELINEVRIFAYGIFTRITGWDNKSSLLFFVICVVILIWLSVRLKNGWAMCVFGATFLFQASFSALVYQLHIWHYISLCFVFIWTIWVLHHQIQEKGKYDRNAKLAIGLLEAFLGILCIGMFLHWNSDEETSNLKKAISGQYSDAANAAEYIGENITSEELFVSTDVPMASTVLAYLPEYEFYFAGNGQRETYADWSEEQSGTITLQDLTTWAEEEFPDKDEFYLLWTGDSKVEETETLEKYEVLYQTDGQTVRGEEFLIYRIPFH